MECPTYAMTSPTKCTDGFYNDASTTSAKCATCPAGYYCTQDDADPAVASLTPHPKPC